MKNFIKVFIVSLMFVTFGSPVFSAELTERELIIKKFEEVSKSVGALYSMDSEGDMSFLCSATAIDRAHGRTVILTANHCTRSGVAYLINFGDNNFRSLSIWKIPHYEISKQKFPKRFNEPDTDMTLFLMEGVDIPIIKVDVKAKVKAGEKVVMVGYPRGVAKISYEGIASGYLDRPGSDEYGYLLLQIFGAPGSSGSSVISMDTGKIIGILTKGTSGSGLPVIFAAPTSLMHNLMIVPGGITK